MVSKVTALVPGAVQQYQRDLPPGSPAWSGSPASFVAASLLSAREPAAPPRAVQAARSSLAGCERPLTQVRKMHPSVSRRIRNAGGWVGVHGGGWGRAGV